MSKKKTVKHEAEVIDLTVDEDFGHPPFKFSVGRGESSDIKDNSSDIVIVDDYTPTKIEEPGIRKRSPSIELRVHPKKQRLCLETTQGSDSEKKDGVLKVKDLFKPKGKKAIADMVLSDDVIEKRFEPLGGLHGYGINLSLAELDMMVSRLFMASVYGGSSQGTFPRVGKEKLAQHGMNDFMYLHMDFQPCAPQIPGRPGLWFNTDTSDSSPFVARVLTRDLKLSRWQYVGQYDVRPAVSLTREEWVKQTDKVKNTWAKQICKKGWGQRFRAKVQARKEVGRKPTHRETENVFKRGRWQNANPDDVMAALDSGQERLAVWTMNCVGYDHVFQLELCERFPRWIPPPKEPKQTRTPKKDTKKGLKRESKSPAKGKRKREIESESESDSIEGSDVDGSDWVSA